MDQQPRGALESFMNELNEQDREHEEHQLRAGCELNDLGDADKNRRIESF